MRPFLLLPAALFACHHQDSTPSPGDDDDAPPPECSVDEDCKALVEICEQAVCEKGDRDNALTEARPIGLGDGERLEGTIYPKDDVDYFVYSSPGAEWVSVRTIDTGSADLNTVVRVYTPSGAPYAVMDDYPAYPFQVSGALESGEAVDFDSVCYVYLPFAGDWYLSVEDRVELPDDPAEGGRSFDYEVLVRQAYGIGEPDTKTDPGGTADLPDSAQSIVAVGVTLEQPGDSDWIEVTNPVNGELEVWGATGLDGSAASPLIRVFDGPFLVAEKVGLGLEWVSWFEGRAGSFVIQATDADGGGGDAYWYPLFVRTYAPADTQAYFGDHLYQPEVEPNDDVSQATSLGAGPDFWLQGQIGVAGEQDWFLASASAGDAVGVRCWTDQFGSQAELNVALATPAGDWFNPVGSGTAPNADDYYLTGVSVPSAGPFGVGVLGAGTTAGPAAWYRCAVYVGT